ncbi:MAG: hypothetical protein NT040_06930 [Bacteroidetes bacterium]|nr:hypothetical protein [Bacteroidota bacterium]
MGRKKKLQDKSLPLYNKLPADSEKPRKYLTRLELQHKVLKKLIDPAFAEMIKEDESGNQLPESFPDETVTE